MQRASCVCLCAAVALLAATSRLGAALVIDPSFSWSDVPKCGLVIEAVYDKQDDGSLSLKITRVLKGEGFKVGDIVSVPINADDGYFIKTDSLEEGKAGDIRPLYFRTHSDYAVDGYYSRPVSQDIRRPAIYFFPSRDKPILAQFGQVQPGGFTDDFTKLLNGQPTDVYFRIAQTLDLEIAAAAVDELHSSRDPKAIEKIIALKFGDTAGIQWTTTQALFKALGDKDGDVFDPLLGRFDSDHTLSYVRWMIAPCMAAVDPARTADALAKRAVDGPWKDEAAAGLRWVPADHAVSFLLERLAANDRPVLMVHSLESVLHFTDAGNSPTVPDETDDQLRRLRALAKPQLEVILDSPKLDDKIKDEIRIRCGFLWAPPAIIIPDLPH